MTGDDDTLTVSKDTLRDIYIEGYSLGKNVEELNDIRRRTAEANFERYFEREIATDDCSDDERSDLDLEIGTHTTPSGVWDS